jgi:hypothetical protein
MIQLLVAVLLTSVSTVGSFAGTSGQGSPWDREVDFGKLRTEYGDRDDYEDLCETDRPLDQMFEALDQEDWPKALEITEGWLGTCPTDIDAHLIRAIAFEQTGDAAGYERHIRWMRGLVESILDSGTGASPDSAYSVISVSEEYSILRVLGLDFDDQATLKGDIDLLIGVDEDGKKHELYFSPAAHFRRLDKKVQEILGKQQAEQR